MGIDILDTLPLRHTFSSTNILDANEQWVSKTFHTPNDNKSATTFAPFAANTKHEPHTFFLGCSDARYNESCLGYKQGDVFSVKTVGNIFRSEDVSTEAALEYAIECVGIKQIIVCGHTDCGGVNTCMLERRDHLQKAHLFKLYDHLKDIDEIIQSNQQEIIKRCGDNQSLANKGKVISMMNVKRQIEKLLMLDCVQYAIANKDLKIHGLIYDVDTHRVERIS